MMRRWANLSFSHKSKPWSKLHPIFVESVKRLNGIHLNIPRLYTSESSGVALGCGRVVYFSTSFLNMSCSC